MPSARAYDAVVEGARAYFEVNVAFEADTDLSAIAQATDGELLEDLIWDLDREFAMTTPKVVDAKGRSRVPQLLLPEHLTVTQLAEILDGGVWPESWILPGRFVWWRL